MFMNIYALKIIYVWKLIDYWDHHKYSSQTSKGRQYRTMGVSLIFLFQSSYFQLTLLFTYFSFPLLA